MHDINPREKTEKERVHNWCEEFPTVKELHSGHTMCVGVIYSVNCDIRLLCLTLLHELMRTREGQNIAAVIELLSGEHQIQCASTLHISLHGSMKQFLKRLY